MKAQYIVAWLRHHNLAFVTAVNELMTRNSPPKLGGEPARTKSEQAGWFPCRYWQLREPPRPRLRSGTPPNLGGECPHSNSFTAPMTAQDFLCKAPSMRTSGRCSYANGRVGLRRRSKFRSPSRGLR